MNKTIQRFMDKVFIDIETDCWIWTAYCNKDGYGNFHYNKKMRRAHRFSFEYFKETIPIGLELDHLCRVRNCVNPFHLEPVTHQENTIRGINFNKEKTYCKHNHEYNEENTHYYITSKGHTTRTCRKCDNMRKKIKA